MKIEILLQEELQRIDEISLKHGVAYATAAGLLAGSIYGNNMNKHTPVQPEPKPIVQPAVLPAPAPTIKPEYKQLVNKITADYRVDPQLANHIVELAFKYQDPVFPRAQDIISLIGVESSFDPNAVSNLKTDPAVGLMQVRPEKWGLSTNDLQTPEQQIKHGVHALSKYYKKLKGNKKAALQAYNVGLRNYKKGVKAPEYVQKFNRESQRFAVNTIVQRG